ASSGPRGPASDPVPEKSVWPKTPVQENPSAAANQSRKEVASLLLAIILMLGLAAVTTAGDEPWDSAAFKADPVAIIKAAESQPAPEGADVVILLEENRYVFEP